MVDLVKYKTRYDADIVAGNVLVGDSDQVVTDYYNAADVSPDTEIRASREQIMEALGEDITEFKALPDGTRDAVTLVLLPDDVAIRGSNARAIILDAFGAGTTTRASLLALQTQLESAAERTRAQRGGILGNSLSVSIDDTISMRAL